MTDSSTTTLTPPSPPPTTTALSYPTTIEQKSRTITRTIPSFTQTDGKNVTVHRSIGTMSLRTLDPFLLLDEFSVPQNGGFPDHPHRGFETVTYMLEGQTQHEDFAGHKGTVGPGDLQWMTAGRGIVHSEMPVRLPRDQEDERAHGLQLWINLPKEHKMCEPQYQELLDGQIPRARPRDGVVIKVIAGESHGVKSQVYTRTPTMFLDFKMDKNRTVTQTIPATYNGFIYVLGGTAYIGDPNSEAEAKAHHTLLLSEDSTITVRIQTKDEEAHFVLIAGEPLREPVVQIGPFVMNTREEVYETYRDYRDGVNGFERGRTWN
ncbi:MAG: RmlC-like cupin domain-containing protein [Linnemannia elongata]|nr:MAG: RmlC-like cupin domain-containing protein [Linnemannia elongata]